ncbi:NAD-dependent epimerase/dehydratase family protein [Haloarcula nitratireducens]|uniref:NAD(P)H-binding protein n=1 Tax=Haloarcula nitratireducens TaxID=2487749 RepID=A0AAW4PJK5_9EURY|nr:NAD-dependent epimerase/dehydratase family protein [Halomicroarcula nitratireducens]MBX0297641.1 NAD(P)H-binding protein [Halomicroarcula nitratireducens]
MYIGITGGTGFMGTHLARRLLADGHQPILISRGANKQHSDVQGIEDAEFVAASVDDKSTLLEAFSKCDTIAHLAGINFERGTQTYQTVHVRGTKNVVEAAEEVGISKIILTSFLRARPDCGSAYHESKWAAETIVRDADTDHTILKPGVTYGQGDHMLNHIVRALVTVPVFPLIGFQDRYLSPLAIEDFVDVIVSSLTEERLSNTTVAVTGPEELSLSQAIRRIGDVIDRDPFMVPTPVAFHYGGAWLQERVMQTPLTTKAQVRILNEGVVEPAPKAVCEPLPDDLWPAQSFTTDRIQRGLPPLEPLRLQDLRW